MNTTTSRVAASSCAGAIALLVACRVADPPADVASPTLDAGVDAASPERVDAGDAAARTDLDRLDDLVVALRTTGDDVVRVQHVEAFLHDVAYGERGFPIRAQGKVAFVYWDRESVGGTFAVSGDFNGWSTTSAPLSRAALGFPFYVRVEDDPTPAGRSLYKIVRGGNVWLADPVARRYGYDDNGEHSLLEVGREDPHLERWPDFGEARGALDARTLAVWVPPFYDPKATPGYPLLLMHDAQNLFGPGGTYGSWHADDAAATAVVAGDVRPFVMVGIANTAARFGEYTHVEDTIPTYGTVGGDADAYVSFVTAGVLPFVRSRYALRAEASQVAVIGSSLGGLVSLYMGLRHGESFGYAGSMSGTLSWGSIGAKNPTMRALYQASPPRGLSIYLDSGGDDGGGCATLSALDSESFHDQYCETLAIRDTLLGLGWVSGTDLVYSWVPGAAHDESAWAARFPAVLRDWFPRK